MLYITSFLSQRDEMCGIAGILFKNDSKKGSLVNTISLMTNSLHHRGPDATKVWIDSEKNIAFGHKRLSIIDISEHGLQPMESISGRFIIVYNGEVYNFKELRKELDKAGYGQWHGESDTEIILAAIEYWGLEKAVSRFIGMFAFALWDKQQQLLNLVRDRMGIKPLYWSLQNGGFLFGSELKSLMAYDAFNAEVDINSLALFMKYKYVPNPGTIFKNVYQLEPATILTIDKNKNINKTKYWNLDDIARSGIEYPDTDVTALSDEVFHLINSAVKYRLVSDVPIGAFLSGGIDSSAIVALMQANSTQPVNTYSIGFSIDSYDESSYAKDVAKHLGTNHTEYILEPQDAIDVIPKLPQIYDEPFSDSSQIPTYLVSNLTSRHVKVALSGDGGDEIFGGYNRYIYADKYLDKLNHLPAWLQRTSKALIYTFSKESWNQLFNFLPSKFSHSQGGEKIYKLASIIGKNNVRMYQELISNWQFNDGLILSDINNQDVNLEKRSYFSSGHSVEYMQLMDQMYYLPNDILTKVDRASMSNSLEVRVPFLDHRVVETMWKLPRHYKINNGVSKVILRKILHTHIPTISFERSKTGFSLPISEWLRGPLRDWAESLLNIEVMTNHGLLNYEIISEKWNEHQSGKNNWHEHIWSVLMFNAWYEQWIEKN